MTTFAFLGDEVISSALTPLLCDAGYTKSNASSAEVIFTYDASLSGLEELYFGDDGIVMKAREKAVFVDLSPAIPSFAEELYQLASVNGATLVAAPLLVKNPVAHNAFASDNLVIVVGAEHDAYEQVRDMLQVLATRVLLVGTVSDAQAYKMSHTIATASGMVSLVEAFASLRMTDAPCDPEDLVDILMTSVGLGSAQDSFVQAIIESDFEGTYTIGIVMAELAAALSWLEETDTLMPQADASFHLYKLLALVGGATYNPAALSLLFAPEEETKAFKVNWAAVEGEYNSDSADGFEFEDYEAECDSDGCTCGHDHHRHHDHGDHEEPHDYGFSAN